MKRSGVPSCQTCGATPPVLYSRDLASPEQRCQRCMADVLPGWRPGVPVTRDMQRAAMTDTPTMSSGRPTVLLPFVLGGLKPEALEAAQASGLPVMPWPLTTDSGYHELIASAWAVGRTFLVVEQDIVPHPGALAALEACPQPWCAYAYDYPPFGLYAGMGCAKFSDRLLQAFPHALEITSTWCDAVHPPKHWRRVDGWLKQYLTNHGQQQHVHGTVKHLHRGQPAHGCVHLPEARDEASAAAGGPALSIIIPTVGRPGLARLLDSIGPSRADELEILLVADSHAERHRTTIDWARGRYGNRPGVRWLEHDGGTNAYGHPQRNYGMTMAQAPWLAFSQDDNVWLPGALQLIRRAIASQPHPRPLLFRVETWQAGAVWREPRLEPGNIDADCIVVPNLPARLGHWTMRYNGDFDFIAETVERWNGDVDWRPDLIARGRPNGMPDAWPQ